MKQVTGARRGGTTNQLDRPPQAGSNVGTEQNCTISEGVQAQPSARHQAALEAPPRAPPRAVKGTVIAGRAASTISYPTRTHGPASKSSRPRLGLGQKVPRLGGGRRGLTGEVDETAAVFALRCNGPGQRCRVEGCQRRPQWSALTCFLSHDPPGMLSAPLLCSRNGVCHERIVMGVC